VRSLSKESKINWRRFLLLYPRIFIFIDFFFFKAGRHPNSAIIDALSSAQKKEMHEKSLVFHKELAKDKANVRQTGFGVAAVAFVMAFIG